MTVFVRRIVLAGMAVAMALSIAVPAQSVFAHGAEEHEHQSDRVKAEDDSSVTTTSATDDSSQRLSAAKLRVCERRETVIKNVMTRSRERADRHLKLFTAIAERTKAFYVKQGSTLANYNELVAATDAAKTHAEASLSAIPTAAEFDCNGTNPKAAGVAFKTALKQEVEDLKAYKAAVKDLVAGVKSVQPKETN